MPDVAPPQVDGDELTVLRASLDYLRSRVAEKLAGVDESTLHVSTLPSGASLYWLGTHLSAVHMIEETARHAGHLDILREEIDGSTGR